MKYQGLAMAIAHTHPGALASSALGYLAFGVIFGGVGAAIEWNYRRSNTYTGSTKNLWDGVPETRDAPDTDPVPRWFRPIYLTVAALLFIGGLIAEIVAGLQAI